MQIYGSDTLEMSRIGPFHCGAGVGFGAEVRWSGEGWVTELKYEVLLPVLGPN